MRLKIIFCAALLFAATAAMAQVSYVFTPTSSGVNYAINNDGPFYVENYPITLSFPYVQPDQYATAQTLSGNFDLETFNNTSNPAISYADSGIVLFFNGGLKLGQLESVSVASTGAPLSVNLWLDTSGNGQFFSFDGTGKMTGLNGDTYGLGGLAPLNGSSDIGMMTAPYGSYTLAQLDSGAFSGVDSNTLAALWVGISSDPSTNSLHTDISTITVNTNQPAAVPEPSSLVSGLIGLMGMGGFAGFKRLKFARR